LGDTEWKVSGSPALLGGSSAETTSLRLEYVRKVLTRVAEVVGGGTRRVTKEPGGCLHLVINP